MSFKPDWLGGGFSATFIDLTLTGDLDFGDASVQSLSFGDDDELRFGDKTGGDVKILWETADASAHYLNIALTGASRNLIISEDAGIDWGHAAQTNPTVWIQSADGTDTTQWVSLAHNQTNGLITTGAGTLDLGTTGTTSHSLGAGDVLVGGTMEVDGPLWVDGTALIINGAAADPDTDLNFAEGGSGKAIFRANFNNDEFLLGISDSVDRTFVITDFDNISKNHDHAAQTNPTLFIHSATDPDTANDEWISLTHDVTDGIIDVGSGGVMFKTAGVEIANMTSAGNFEPALNINMNAATRITHDLASGAIGIADGNQTLEQPFLFTGATSNAWVISEWANQAFDHAHTLQTNPTLYIHSTNQSTTEWIGLTHDGTDAVIDQGAGTTKLAGGLTYNVTTVNAATYDLLITDNIVHVTYTGTGAVTSLTLPTAQTLAGRVIVIKDAGGNAAANNITVDTEGAEAIDGNATAVINGDYDSINLYSDGSNWFIF